MKSRLLPLVTLALAGCGSTQTRGSDDSVAGTTSTNGGSGTGGATNTEGGSTAPTAGEAAWSPTYGRFGTSTSSFTLPLPTASSGSLPVLYHRDLAQDFPDVAWSTIDRLYIPAAAYKSILLGGLPDRSADHPLIITNSGGQVKVGGQAANYVFVLEGGKHWTLTGRYDPISETGDAQYRGHAEGQFAHSQGSYGIYVDDGFSKSGLSGLAIGGRASDFELELVEIARVDFAGIVAKTDDDASAIMRNVRLHDVYVHDTGSEGIYFGSTQAQPQHAFEHLEVYDNRLLRTGTEALQIGQQGDGCEVHHNVLGPAATRWRSAFQRYQDGNIQYGQGYGSGRIHHNIVIGTGDLFVEFFPTVVAGDPRSATDTVTFSENYFSDTSSGGVYTHADDTQVHIVFERNSFRGFRFNYTEVYPDASAPVQVFGVGSNSPNPHVLRDNVYDAPFPFVRWTFPSVTEQDNIQGAVPQVEFRDFMGSSLDRDYRRIEFWTSTATLSPDQPAVVYASGALVLHQGTLYQAMRENSGKPPDQSGADWKALPAPADDVRLSASSPHAGLGLRWPPP